MKNKLLLLSCLILVYPVVSLSTIIPERAKPDIKLKILIPTGKSSNGYPVFRMLKENDSIAVRKNKNKIMEILLADFFILVIFTYSLI
jgi:hypothetical protein